MGARSEALAKAFEAKAAEMTAALEKLSDADWKKVTAAEKWPVGVTAHHVASSHEGIAGLVKTLAGGQSVPNLTMAMIDEGNAQHAKEFANVAKPETIALHKKGVAAAASVVRGIDDPDLDRSATVLQGMPAMSTQQAIEGILINHITGHLGSIKATVGG